MKKIKESNVTLNVLCLEDVLKDAELLNEMLVDAGYLVSMDIAMSEQEYVDFLKGRNYDIIVADNSLPNFDVFSALEVAQALKPEIPFICVSGTIGEEKAVELLKLGACDYVIKDRLNKLAFAVQRALEENRTQKEKRQSDKALYDSYVFSKSLLNTIPFGMNIVDESGIILFLSDQLKNIFGEGAIGKKCWELYRDDKKQCGDCPLLKGINIGETETYESHGILGNKIFDISYTGIMYDGKKAMLEIFQDITVRKEKEVELIIAKEKAEESDRLKSAFLANMSHEIRTPMNGILGFTELLKEPNLTGEEQQKYIQIIEKSGTRMLNIMNNIISISKIESGLIELNISEININEQIEYLYTFFKPAVEGKGMRFFYNNSLPFRKANIKTDREKLFAILTNLIENAIKYSEEGSIEFGYDKKGKYIELYVKDSGIGIINNRQEAIFERFIQADIADKNAYQGAGLGLSISKAYVEMLGGKLWVESETGIGSTFYFTIPYTTELLKTDGITNSTAGDVMEVQAEKLKIIIVEDDETSDLLLNIMLSEIGKEILHAKSGLEAIELCRNNPDTDLILMDIKMPVMDGHEATRQIRQFNKDVIIIAQTAHGLSGDKENAIVAGCNAYISKPIRKVELLSLIQQ